MKKINCAIIQDLLPSYCDKISSNETNLLVEEHLRSCSNCKQTLEQLNKDLHIESLNNQQEEIDYLKGYRRNKKRSIIFAIVLSLIIIDVCFLIYNYILSWIFMDKEYDIDINNVNPEYMYVTEYPNGQHILTCFLYSNRNKRLKSYITQSINPSTGIRATNIMLVGTNIITPINTTYCSGAEEYVDIDKTDKIYIQDTIGHRKEIWNKNTNVPSKEEWAKWYVDSYMPEAVKTKLHIDYNTIMYKSYYTTGMWRHLYKLNLD